MSSRCERCNRQHHNPLGLWDYCASCYKNLCDRCMDQGCCGNVPAESGQDQDCVDSLEDPGGGR